MSFGFLQLCVNGMPALEAPDMRWGGGTCPLCPLWLRHWRIFHAPRCVASDVSGYNLYFCWCFICDAENMVCIACFGPSFIVIYEIYQRIWYHRHSILTHHDGTNRSAWKTRPYGLSLAIFGAPTNFHFSYMSGSASFISNYPNIWWSFLRVIRWSNNGSDSFWISPIYSRSFQVV